jgi:hypothetical protein
MEDKTVAPVSEDRVQHSSALVEIDGVSVHFHCGLELQAIRSRPAQNKKWRRFVGATVREVGW